MGIDIHPYVCRRRADASLDVTVQPAWWRSREVFYDLRARAEGRGFPEGFPQDVVEQYEAWRAMGEIVFGAGWLSLAEMKDVLAEYGGWEPILETVALMEEAGRGGDEVVFAFWFDA